LITKIAGADYLQCIGKRCGDSSGIRQQNTKVKFEYAVLKQDDIKKGLHPTTEELKAFYGHPSEKLREFYSEKPK